MVNIKDISVKDADIEEIIHRLYNATNGGLHIPYVLNNHFNFQRWTYDIGEELIDLHLSKKRLNIHEVNADIQDRLIQKCDYHDEKLYINKTSYFEIPFYIWCVEIRCYQVAQKWIKDRKGRSLTDDEIQNYMQIIASLSKFCRLIVKIDNMLGGDK